MKNTNAVKQVKRDAAHLEKRRKKGIELLKEGGKQSEVARILHVSRQAVNKWKKSYRTNGKKGMLSSKATGRPVKMEKKKLLEFKEIILEGARKYGFLTDTWDTKRLAAVIMKKYRVSYHRAHVSKILHALGLSWQKPSKRAMERNENAVKRWIKKDLPEIKKKRINKGQK